MTPVERATVAAMAGAAAEYTAHDTYLSPRTMPPHMPMAQTLSNRRDYHADALDPRREYMVERASLRGAVALATRRREPWHALLCAVMGDVWREMLHEDERATGVRHDHADVFTWAETLREDPCGGHYCPTHADCRALLSEVQRRMLDGLATLSQADLLTVLGHACPGLRLSLREDGGGWLASSTMTYAPRPLARRSVTSEGAAADLLAILPQHMLDGERRVLGYLAGVSP